jgi:hypothetical protein
VAVSLKEIEAMVDLLDPTDQVRLLRYLMLRLADPLEADAPKGSEVTRAWQEFKRVGERLAASSNFHSLSQAIIDMRR